MHGNRPELPAVGSQAGPGKKQDFCKMGIVILPTSKSCFETKLKDVSAWCRSKHSINISFFFFFKLSVSIVSMVMFQDCHEDCIREYMQNS